MRRLFVFLALLIALPAAAAPLSEQDRADIARVEHYLNGFSTLEAKFMQIAPDGGISEGRVYFHRPGRLRVDYAPPVPVLVVASGGWMNYYDKELKQTNRLPLDSSPLSVLLAKEVRLSGDIEVLGISRETGTLKLTVQDGKKPEEGQLTLVFSERPFQFRQWVIRDRIGQNTTVSLSDTRFDAELDPRLFTHARELEDMRPSSGGRGPVELEKK